MQLNVESQSKNKKAASTLVVFTSFHKKGKEKQLKLESSLSKETKKLIQEAYDDKSYCSNKAASLYFRNAQCEGHDHLLAFGLGDDSKVDSETLRSVGGSLYKTLSPLKLNNVDIHVDSAVKSSKTSSEYVQALVEGLELSAYSFDQYKTKKDNNIFFGSLYDLISKNKIYMGLFVNYLPNGLGLSYNIFNKNYIITGLWLNGYCIKSNINLKVLNFFSNNINKYGIIEKNVLNLDCDDDLHKHIKRTFSGMNEMNNKYNILISKDITKLFIKI